MPQDRDWNSSVSNLIKSELKLRGLTYAQLADKLQEMGIDEREWTIRNKLSRGRFSAAFMAQCLAAIGSDRLRLD